MNTKTTPDDEAATGATIASTEERRSDATKPLTVMLSEDLLRRLKVIAVLKDTSVSEIVAEHIGAIVRRDRKKAIAKLDA